MKLLIPLLTLALSFISHANTAFVDKYIWPNKCQISFKLSSRGIASIPKCEASLLRKHSIDFSNIKEIPYEKISLKTDILHPDSSQFGGDSSYFQLAEYDEKVVFYKEPNENNAQELYNYYRLQQLGIETHLIGYTLTPQGNIAIVAKFIRGYFMRCGNEACGIIHRDITTFVGEHTFAELQRIFNILEANKIDHGEFQFIVGANGIPYLVDLANYNYNPKYEKWTPEVGLNNINKFNRDTLKTYNDPSLILKPGTYKYDLHYMKESDLMIKYLRKQYERHKARLQN